MLLVNQYPPPSPVEVMATMGWLWGTLPSDPKNGAPKEKTPPSDAVNQ